MRSYWQDRPDSRPQAVSEEATLAGWAVRLDGSIAEAVGLAPRHSARFVRQEHVVRVLGERVSAHPAAYADLPLHLLRRTEWPSTKGIGWRRSWRSRAGPWTSRGSATSWCVSAGVTPDHWFDQPRTMPRIVSIAASLAA